MALHLEYQSVLGGSFVEIDLAADRVGNFVCKFSDSHPAVLEFDVVAAQHTIPMNLRGYLRFWDDAGTTPDGSAQSTSNPLFEGIVWEIEPAESNLLKYLAYDPSQLSGKEIPVMSTAWNAAVGSAQPLPADDAVPRLVLNGSSIDNDVDYAFSRADGQTVGQIIQLVLDDAIEPLRWYEAAPGADVAYQTSDMATFDFVPQEKIVSTNESIRSFLDRLTQQHYPEFAFRWDPGTHYWRWYSRLAGTARTLTLNDPAAANTVITMEIHRSLDGRYPAVKFYGPETTEVAYFSTLDGLLTITSPATVLETYTDSGGVGTANAYTQFQITDAAYRRGAKLLPTTTLVRENDFYWVGTRSPMFEITFDGGSTWQALESVVLDFQQGIVNIPSGVYPAYYIENPGPGTNQHFYTPNGYRLIWAPYAAPLSVRSPSSGFSGTSNTVAGSTACLHIYDEMLAVGTNRLGEPVTTASRLAAFQKLADSILTARKDIIYTGGCVLEGLQYDFCRMSRNINIAAVDADGDAITTGWEAINAVVSDVEYNFAEQTTSLTFSSEALSVLGDSVDTLKARLKIGLIDKIRQIKWQMTWGHFESKYANKPGGYHAWTGLVYSDTDLFWDKKAGTFEEGFR